MKELVLFLKTAAKQIEQRVKKSKMGKAKLRSWVGKIRHESVNDKRALVLGESPYATKKAEVLFKAQNVN